MFCMMEYILKKVSYEDAPQIFNLMQYARRTGSLVIQNKMNDEHLYGYRSFENHVNESNRDTYLILDTNYNVMGFVMVNRETKVVGQGHRLSQLLILPQYRRRFLGQRVCQEVFGMYEGNWEVEPLFNDMRSYVFFKRAIEYYTNKVCEFKQRTFVFSKKNM